MSDRAQAAVPAESPLMQAWTAYKQTEDYANGKAWALHIAPIVHAGDPEGEAKRRFDLMPLEQRERHVEGALWAAFMAGFLHTPRPLEPTAAMIEAGAQRLVRWETGQEKWPESWSALDVRASRNDAERVWRSMWLAAMESK